MEDLNRSVIALLALINPVICGVILLISAAIAPQLLQRMGSLWMCSRSPVAC